MNRNQLEIFRVVAEKKSFSEAARLLHISQPAISMHIQALEEYYGTKLLDRTTKRVTLTPAGEILYKYTLHLLSLMDKAQRDISQAAGIIKGKLILGASLTIGGHVLPPLLSSFYRKYPDVNITMEIMNTEKVLERVSDLTLDLGFVEGEVTTGELHVEALARDELVVVVAANHPLAGRGRISWEELATLPLVMREPGSGTRKVIEERLQAAGFKLPELKIVMELGSTEAIKGAVEAGLGAAILSKWTVRREINWGIFKQLLIENLPIYREFYVVLNNNKFHSPATQALIQFCREHLS
ncbi:selenium metabolism-associated LysR family transcriptional regulator [Carboxydothermus hydrogenoformans]|uniref:Transcriptional regulator, LysR family n=1 Tax=Carboxydothermus hydrogenoformans (strain ATCC BAA-161 / DSM 6008 / Z-2901) TaxID=246194 RepID=Q3AG49_CARHZ|nr:selenium metabolism-associated LysR family transcriptional regulator [Carboxydothermus hydrogenoformans]ABB15748.1 transcriptional regulator, LysR family [Carboxydothermus hydrogenoformans Z-2901]